MQIQETRLLENGYLDKSRDVIPDLNQETLFMVQGPE